MQRDEIREELKNLIESDLKIKIKDDNQDLLGSKIIDSYTMLLIITFIREELELELNMDKIDFETFTSINTIVDFILRSQ